MTEKATHPFLEGLNKVPGYNSDLQEVGTGTKKQLTMGAIEAMVERRTPTKRERVIVKSHYDKIKKSR